jgi:hypothetical protein
MSDYNILEPLSVESRKLVRECIISQVLATDMAMHFDWTGKISSD